MSKLLNYKVTGFKQPNKDFTFIRYQEFSPKSSLTEKVDDLTFPSTHSINASKPKDLVCQVLL